VPLVVSKASLSPGWTAAIGIDCSRAEILDEVGKLGDPHAI
jgi:hypothetical protein